MADYLTKPRRLCYFSGGRSDYNRMRYLLKKISSDPLLEIELVMSSTHLEREFGETANEVIQDGLEISAFCDISSQRSDPASLMAQSLSAIISKFSAILREQQSDIVLVHGDRYEAVGAALSAISCNIPVAHIEGGETSGSIDELFRHTVTKLSTYHFVATKRSHEYLLRLGEKADHVFHTGCPVVDVLSTTSIPSRHELSNEPLLSSVASLLKKKDQPFIVAIFHPVTTEIAATYRNTVKWLEAFIELGLPLILLLPNHDPGRETIVEAIKGYERRLPLYPFTHLPFSLFWGLLAHSAALVGNSSVGIREAPYIGLPVVNVGTRQFGRERGPNVIDVNYDGTSIVEAIRLQVEHGKYPSIPLYGTPGASERIVSILKSIPVENVVQKHISYLQESASPGSYGGVTVEPS